MWGSRCRVGLINPTIVELPLAEFFHIVPEGVSLAITSLSIKLSRQATDTGPFAKIDQAVGLLGQREVNCIIAPSAPITELIGADGDKQFIERCRDQTGIPATTSNMAVLDALEALGVGRVAIATPFEDDHHEQPQAFLKRNGVEVAAAAPLRSGVVPYRELSLSAAYLHAKETFFRDPTAEAIYSTAWSSPCP